MAIERLVRQIWFHVVTAIEYSIVYFRDHFTCYIITSHVTSSLHMLHHHFTCFVTSYIASVFTLHHCCNTSHVAPLSILRQYLHCINVGTLRMLRHFPFCVNTYVASMNMLDYRVIGMCPVPAASSKCPEPRRGYRHIGQGPSGSYSYYGGIWFVCSHSHSVSLSLPFSS